MSVAGWLTTGLAGLAIIGLLILLAIWIRVQRLRPSNDRSWVNDNSRNAAIDFEGDITKIKNIRDFNWRSTRDYDERWIDEEYDLSKVCLLYTSPSPRDRQKSRMPSSA